MCGGGGLCRHHEASHLHREGGGKRGRQEEEEEKRGTGGLWVEREKTSFFSSFFPCVSLFFVLPHFRLMESLGGELSGVPACK